MSLQRSQEDKSETPSQNSGCMTSQGQAWFPWARKSPAPLRVILQWSTSLTKSTAKPITPASPLASARSTLREQKLYLCFSNFSAIPSPLPALAPHFHWFKGLHSSIHWRCGGMLSALPTLPPAQCYPTSICSQQMWGWTPLKSIISSSRPCVFLCSRAEVADALVQCHHREKGRCWRLSPGTRTQPYHGVQDDPSPGWAHEEERLQVSSLPQARLQLLALCFSSWRIGRQQ